jgi:hypothetical protein
VSELFEVDFSESDPLDTNPAPKPGKAHVLVKGIKKKENSIEVQMVVLAHEEDGQRTKELRTWLSFKGKNANRASQFCLATGIVPPDYFQAKKSTGENRIGLPLNDSIGKTFCTTITNEDFNGRPSAKVGYDFTSPTSPKAENYPRDMNYVGDDDEAALDAQLTSAPEAVPAAPVAASVTEAPDAVLDDADVPF